MKYIVLLLLLPACAFGQAGNACSSNTAAATGTIQSNAFCQPLAIDGRIKGGWIAVHRAGDQSNNEPQCYAPQNVFIQNGILTIMARSLVQKCNYYPVTNGGVPPYTMNFSSGFVQWNTFSFTGGDILIRMKGPANPGGEWPAVWLLGANCQYASQVTSDNTTFNGKTCNWFASGSEEIDIFEQIGTVVSSNCSLHATGGVTNTYSFTDSSLAFHIYEVRWISGTSLQWYYDGVLQSGCNQTVGTVPSTPMFLNMNLAITSTGTSTGLPQSMQVDWVKVCQPSPCNGSGGNIIFYDDFVTPVAISLIRPTARAARMAGSSLPPSAVFTMGVAKNEEPKFR